MVDEISALEKAREAAKTVRSISLMYHDVIKDGHYDSSGFEGEAAARYKLSLEAFENHLVAIAEAIDGNPVTVPEVSNKQSGSLPVLLTFDDGGLSAHSCIADTLERRQWRGHFFVTVGQIGKPSFLSRGQILDLHRRGHVIGSHSLSHPERMSHCTTEELDREWQESIEVLSEITGTRIMTASVPGGFHSRKVAEAAARAGVKTLFTSEPTTMWHCINGCSVLGRYTIQRGMLPATLAELAGGSTMPRLRQLIMWNAKKVAKAFGGQRYLKLRSSLIRQGKKVGSPVGEHPPKLDS